MVGWFQERLDSDIEGCSLTNIYCHKYPVTTLPGRTAGHTRLARPAAIALQVRRVSLVVGRGRFLGWLWSVVLLLKVSGCLSFALILLYCTALVNVGLLGGRVPSYSTN